MENASKALLIAGGIFLAMLVLGLIFFARTRISDFYNKKDEFAQIEDIAKFNLEFTNYEKRDVYGYELISLANKVADYNMRFSNSEGAQNDQKYNSITMRIYLNGNADKFRFSASKNAHTFFEPYNNKAIEQSVVNNGIEKIIKDALGIEDVYKGVNTTTKLAKSINSLILTQEQLNYNKTSRNIDENASKKIAAENYKSITNENLDYDTMVSKLTASGSDIMKYYEYYQFKKAKFKCSKISFDSVTDRVNEINFEFSEL